MRVNMTDRSVRTLKPPATGQIDYFDRAVPGFGLRVTAGGARSWIVLYRHHGRKRRVTLGPENALSLAEARAKAKDMLARAHLGEDPAGVRRAEREAATFAEVAREYIERHAKKTNRSWREQARMLETDLVPRWGTQKARDIEARDVRALVDTIIDRGSPIAANRTFALIRRVFNWAAAPDRALVPQHHNPTRGMERPAPERQRERVLEAGEVRRVWRALDGEDVFNAALFRLYLLTGQRGGELRTMRWEDLDLEERWWTIPAERAKNGRAHRVPLSAQAVAILRTLPRHDAPWLFASGRAAAGCRATITKAVARLREASAVDFWPHDLRRTVATFLTSELRVSRLVVSKLLNHVERGVTAVYDRASYDREKRAALDAWGRRLEGIVNADQTARVVPLRAG